MWCLVQQISPPTEAFRKFIGARLLLVLSFFQLVRSYSVCFLPQNTTNLEFPVLLALGPRLHLTQIIPHVHLNRRFKVS